MESESSLSFRLDLEITPPCPTLIFADTSKLKLLHLHKNKTHHRSSCLSKFCWEVAQNWIILDPVFSLIRKKLYDSIKTFPEEPNYCISAMLLCSFLNELIKIQEILSSTFLPYCSLMFTMQFVSHLNWKKKNFVWTSIIAFEWLGLFLSIQRLMFKFPNIFQKIKQVKHFYF